MKLARTIGAGAALAALLAACGSLEAPPGPPTSVAGPPTADWRRDWLRGIPCAAPCFQGVTPGTVSQTETLELLRAGLEPVSPTRRPPDEPGFPASVAWLIDRMDRGSGTNAYYYERSPRPGVPADTIVSVAVGGSGFITLDEALAAFGEPSHALAFSQPAGENRTRSALGVVYLERGVMLQLDAPGWQRRAAIDREAEVVGAVFFVPTLAGFDAALQPFVPASPPSDFLTPWQGFKAFADYCRAVGSGSPPLPCP